MAVELERKALLASLDEDFELAVHLFTKALEITPNNAEFLASRAQAHIKLHNYTEAVHDAIKATQLDPSMATAYMRKGIACFNLEEYHTAKLALEKGVAFAQNDPRFAKLIEECNNCHAAEEIISGTVGHGVSASSGEALAVNISATVGHGASASSVNPRYRHDYFQTPEEVVVAIFAKGIPDNNVVVGFSVQRLGVVIEVPGQTSYSLHLGLFGKIIPDKSRYAVMSTKVEIHLAKAEVLNWTSLEIKDKDRGPTYPPSKAKVVDSIKSKAEIELEDIFKRLKAFGLTDTQWATRESLEGSLGPTLPMDQSAMASQPHDDVGRKKRDP